MTKAALYDSWRIASRLTPVRFINLIRLKWSYWYSRLRGKSNHKGYPFALSIEPTTACNLGCPACPSGLKAFSRATGKIDLVEHEQWLKQISKQVFYVNYYFQGEPFLHPQFLELIKSAGKQRIYTATSTNAHFIDTKKAHEIVASGLDRLIISIDGLTQETYSSYRVNGQLEKVLDATRHLVEAKKAQRSKTPFLIFQFLVVRANEHETDDLLALAEKIGVDEVRFKTAQVYDYEFGNPLIPENDHYSRYRKRSDGTYTIKFKGGNHCWRMWSSSVITWDGKVVPCCFDKDAEHKLGDLRSQSFKNIWKSPVYKDFRDNVLQNRDAISICNNCSEGAKVWAD